MEAVLELSSLASGISVERLRASWAKVVREVIMPLKGQLSSDIVIELHNWLRITKGSKYKVGAWNILSHLEQEIYECNCVCSTIFILLACAELGLFPSRIKGASIPNHVFITNATENYEFETTKSCQTGWTLLSEKDRKKSTSIDSWACIHFIIAQGLVETNSKKEDTSEQNIHLLKRFPSLTDPAYYNDLYREKLFRFKLLEDVTIKEDIDILSSFIRYYDRAFLLQDDLFTHNLVYVERYIIRHVSVARIIKDRNYQNLNVIIQYRLMGKKIQILYDKKLPYSQKLDGNLRFYDIVIREWLKKLDVSQLSNIPVFVLNEFASEVPLIADPRIWDLKLQRTFDSPSVENPKETFDHLLSETFKLEDALFPDSYKTQYYLSARTMKLGAEVGAYLLRASMPVVLHEYPLSEGTFTIKVNIFLGTSKLLGSQDLEVSWSHQEMMVLYKIITTKGSTKS